MSEKDERYLGWRLGLEYRNYIHISNYIHMSNKIYISYSENLKEGEYLEDLGVDGKIRR
jgi:hypothetical protein